ncbi:hypothetical protein Pmani_036728 [Petrolisthes manimaculis]|uniref:Uncharacterized protein n=1 Tax=Petrolisthes manimaculis TaxID=1843537 RepID=A0AAE1NIV1_9EUCA|nr:hypothetical protein Pmani_036728 [Petrolisthes manimaculis]
MQYKFSQFTGRLSTPPHLDIPTKYVQYTERPRYQFILETPTSVNDHPHTRARRLGGGKYYAPVPDTLLKKMRLFQVSCGFAWISIFFQDRCYRLDY